MCRQVNKGRYRTHACARTQRHACVDKRITHARTDNEQRCTEKTNTHRCTHLRIVVVRDARQSTWLERFENVGVASHTVVRRPDEVWRGEISP